METASKALLIAAAVLVVIILIAVGMKIYTSTSGTQKIATDTGKTISDKTGDAKDLAISEITGKKSIDYKGKTKETIKPGDDIIIGGTENFRVFSVKNGEIKAMPFYNLVILTTDGTVKQGPAVEGLSTEIRSTFATEKYWTTGEDKIDMGNRKNNIQQYIIKYKTALEGMKANVEVRAVSKSELDENGVTKEMIQPVSTGGFWLCSGRANSPNLLWFAMHGTTDYNLNYYAEAYVRPIIIIQK